MSVPNWAALGITGLNWAFITDRGVFNILCQIYTGEQIDNRTSRSAFADKKSSNIKYTYLEHLDIISLTLAHFPKMLLYNFPVLILGQPFVCGNYHPTFTLDKENLDQII